MKRRVTLVLLSLLFLVPATISAQEANTATGSSQSTAVPTPKVTPVDLRRVNSADREAQIKALKEAALKKREEVKSTLRQNLTQIKDAKKQEVVNNIDERIANRNAAWITHWNEVLQRLTGILDKVERRAQELGSAGTDISGLTAVISTARTSISTAQAKVDAQNGKAYAITVTDDSLGQNVKATIELFRTDVKAVVGSLNDARRAVDTAFKALRALALSGTPVPSPRP